ncbi:purine-cytosine permease family protein [Modestobacter sp. VKM Ac-2978]|uniref:purine-cytosine permease family protein n=1 Tax=Modestobacter sp. VKM Ac-2978 TaxID=3004132 RepID=UPI0022AA5561|nr:cytosine permease [Modestobacter sp. VKM Ac-2978]MCZ2849823.1 cytosine permease [Modestobacter sp. VKM Ac-2978]
MTTEPAATAPLVQFETRHIMPIPEDERNGSVRSLFSIWVGINMLPLTVVTGAIATGSFGLSIWWSIVAILTGNVIGAFGSALHASQGPQLGVPQMLQARAQFGFYGGSLLAFIALLMFLGFFASILVVAKDSLLAVFPELNPRVVIIVFAVVGIAIAAYGYDLVRKAMAVLSVIIAVVVIIAMVMLWFEPSVTGANPDAGFTVAGFFGMLAIGVVWQLAYAPYVSDYSRYLPKDTGVRPAFWATYLGLVLSSVFVMILGVLLGSVDPSNPLGAMASVLGPIGTVGLLIFALSAAMINAAELYSGVMCALTGINSTFSRVVVTSRTRVLTTLVCGAIATAAALAGESDFVTMFQNFVTILLYVLIPWSAINLMDYFVIRKGHYAIEELFQRDGGRYGRWNVIGLSTYAIGLVVQIPFMVTPMYTGPLAEPLGFIDVAWIVGFVVSGAVYLVLTRTLGTRGSVDHGETAVVGDR